MHVSTLVLVCKWFPSASHMHMYSQTTSRVQPVHVVTRACDHTMLPSSLSWPSRGWSSAGAEVGREVRPAGRWSGEQNTEGAHHVYTDMPLPAPHHHILLPASHSHM